MPDVNQVYDILKAAAILALFFGGTFAICAIRYSDRNAATLNGRSASEALDQRERE